MAPLLRVLSLLAAVTGLAAALGDDAPAAGAFWSAKAARVGAAWPAPLPHVPSFFVVQENQTMLGSMGEYELPYYAIRDASAPASGVVAVYVPSSSINLQGYARGSDPELTLLVPLPSLAPPQLPLLPRYGWAWLWGAKVVTIPWLDCCNITGDVSAFSFSPDGQASLTLTQTQAWVPNGGHKGRNATSKHTFTLRFDASVGYCFDIRTSIVINAAAAPAALEFINFLTPALANPWPLPAPQAVLPAAPRPTLTAWSGDAGASWRGFAMNLLAGAMLGRYNVSNSSAPLSWSLGAVSMVAPGSWSAALAFAGPYLFEQATCPTWADQHQFVRLPAAGPDGYVAAAPTFSLAFLPPAASDFILGAASVITHVGDGSRGNGSSVMLRLGELEDFSRQPVPLTQPLRALVQASYLPDYALRPEGGGGRPGPALAIKALTPNASAALYAFANALPLVPLNASTISVARALALAPPDEVCPGGGGIARIRLILYEADDFNVIGDRRIFHDSTANATAADGWMLLTSLNFTSPPYSVYADVRLEALSATDAEPCAETATALFDNFFFGRAEDSPLAS